MKKILILTFSLLLIPFAAFAQSVTVTGMGGSEKTALKDAMRLAIERVLGAHIKSQTITENYSVIKDRISTNAEGYITRYDVLENRKENGIFYVTIKADVRDDVASVILSDKEKRAKVRAGLSDPRIAVVATGSDVETSETAKNAFIVGLKKIGFSRIVNNRNNADFLVTVNINKQRTGAFGAKYTINANITKIKTGEIIFAGSEKSSGAGESGRARAVRQATENILEQIDIKTLEIASNPENHITIIISNHTPKITSMQNFLSELPGVNNVYLRRSNNNISEFDLDYLGDATDLAQLLESKGIKIKAVERDMIKI